MVLKECDFEGYLVLADIYEAGKRGESALECLLSALELEPVNGSTLARIAYLETNRGNYEHGLQFGLQAAGSLETAELYITLGRCYFAKS